jgi:hypothetical protein
MQKLDVILKLIKKSKKRYSDMEYNNKDVKKCFITRVTQDEKMEIDSYLFFNRDKKVYVLIKDMLLSVIRADADFQKYYQSTKNIKPSNFSELKRDHLNIRRLRADKYPKLIMLEDDSVKTIHNRCQEVCYGCKNEICLKKDIPLDPDKYAVLYNPPRAPFKETKESEISYT